MRKPFALAAPLPGRKVPREMIWPWRVIDKAYPWQIPCPYVDRDQCILVTQGGWAGSRAHQEVAHGAVIR